MRDCCYIKVDKSEVFMITSGITIDISGRLYSEVIKSRMFKSMGRCYLAKGIIKTFPFLREWLKQLKLLRSYKKGIR